MPWVRIDENAMDHPKIGGLSDGAFRLWVQGLAYCQKYLTNGYISDIALRGLRAFSPKRKEQLMIATLWDLSGAGIIVHDYLDWNESREHVTQVRKEARERMSRLRAGSRERAPNVRDGAVTNVHNPHHTTPPRGSEKQNPPRARGDTDELSQRAGAFCQWYEDTHERLFHVGYIGSRSDYENAVRLCEKLSDAELRDAALVWFGMEDDFATTGTRSIAKFASRATGCLQLVKARGIA
jgi:hypothetical protein